MRVLVFLGDSNADNGNVLRMTHGTYPSANEVYWQGRYCNGKAWVDHLEDLSGFSPALNLAHGNATIDNSIVSGTVPMPPDGKRKEVPSVVDQVIQLKDLVGQLTPTDVVFVQAGSNDLNSLVTDELSSSPPSYITKREFTPQLLAQRLRAAVHQLCINAGARNVVILNVRSREDYPSILALNDPKNQELTFRLTHELNAAIADEIVSLQNALGHVYSIAVFDTYTFQKKIVENPTAFGIDPDVRTPCFSANISSPSSVKDTDAPLLLNPESQLFLDGAHLAKRAQALLAAEIIKLLALQAIASN
ncbi:hypothetical protein GGI26_004442 [Coemansia sp. RSA 1358]|nr:hypothetical protein GGI26_004442 [Coemansia sp. RSA 1358]